MATRTAAIALTAAGLISLAGCAKTSPFAGTWEGTFAFVDADRDAPQDMPDFTMDLASDGGLSVMWTDATGMQEVTGTWAKGKGKLVAFEWADTSAGDLPSEARLDKAGNLVVPFQPAEGAEMTGTFTKIAPPEPAPDPVEQPVEQPADEPEADAAEESDADA